MNLPNIRRRKPKRRWHRRTPPGAVPGMIVHDPEAPRPVVRILAYGPEAYEETQIDDPGRIREFRGRYPVTWVNVDGLGDAEVIRQIGDLLGLHRLALEDVVHVHQRPKVDDYGEYLFIVTRMVVMNDQLGTEQISMFLGDGYVVTFQEHVGDCLDGLRDRLRKGSGRIRSLGADYLAYAVLDTVIDHWFPALEQFGEHLEDLGERVIGSPDPETISQVYSAKRDLMTLRRAVWPQREAINSLLRDPTAVITADTRIYLRDCYDHIVQIIDILENDRDLASGLMDVYLSSVSNRTNDVMKVLTIFAAIFIPLSFIAGLYGMNFNHDVSPWNMPELEWYHGYPFALTLMATTAVVLLSFFWWKGWLSSSSGKSGPRHDGARDDRTR